MLIHYDKGTEPNQFINVLITEIKNEVINSDTELSTEDIEQIVNDKAIEFNININSETVDKIVDLVWKVK